MHGDYTLKYYPYIGQQNKSNNMNILKTLDISTMQLENGVIFFNFCHFHFSQYLYFYKYLHRIIF